MKLAKFNEKFSKETNKNNLPELIMNQKKVGDISERIKTKKKTKIKNKIQNNIEEFLKEKGKNCMNVILLTNNNVNIKGNNNLIISDTSKFQHTQFSKFYKRTNTEKGNSEYKKDFDELSLLQDNNEIQFPFIIQSLMKNK
jgi:hypothetical protein